MEDIDEPRCVKGADSLILQALDEHHLHWDGSVIYQSTRHKRYQDIIDDLLAKDLAYYCQCTRKQIHQYGGIYPGLCRNKNIAQGHHAIRVRIDSSQVSFTDNILGNCTITDKHALQDTIIKRRDGYYAYNLVVVVDDIDQGVNHIVRGSDLLETTAAQLSLYGMLNAAKPTYSHVPVAVTRPGLKLSKQNQARAISPQKASENLGKALAFLGNPVPNALLGAPPSEIIAWATQNWHYSNVPKQREIVVDSAESTYHNAAES